MYAALPTDIEESLLYVGSLDCGFVQNMAMRSARDLVDSES